MLNFCPAVYILFRESQSDSLSSKCELLSCLVLVGVGELLGVVDEGLLEVAHHLLPDGLLHGEVPLEVLHVALRYRPAGRKGVHCWVGTPSPC